MGFILMFVIIGASGADVQAAPFKTLQECEAVRAEIPAKLAKYNTQTNAKVLAYSAACVAVEKAPAGTKI